MKILLINKFHYSRDGGTRAYFDLAKILTAHGHEVAFFSMRDPKNDPSVWSEFFADNSDYQDEQLSFRKKISSALNIFYNFQAAARLAKLLQKFRPDVAHLHVIYHQLSPSIIAVLKKHKIPTVMTLHDFKLICPNYNLLVRGKIWERSKPDRYYRCFFDRCVKDSYAKSLVCVIEAYLHKFLKIYEKIDVFISPSEFLIKKFREFDFKKEMIYLPNPVFFQELNEQAAAIQAPAERYILYYGRLSEEKGIDDLLRAYARQKTEAKLKIVGRGNQEAELKKIVKDEKIGNVEFLGYKTDGELWREVKGAELIVVPSRWYENAPYSVIESMALGKIVVAARIGGLSELIRDDISGFLFEPGDVDDLAAKLDYILSYPELKTRIGAQAIAAVQEKNDPEKFYQALLKIYQQVRKP